ncbi:MAG TPA: Ig-like domain-containing protein [Gemmatimonadales bacterium]|nr:Ig-like domain-containing protein [Gemmatimonadales bacterium]
MRTAVRLAAVTLVGLVACIEPMTTPALDGGLALVMPAPSTPLDSGHVVLKGPTNETVTVTPGATVTISSLAPGSYTVALEGFQGGGVAYFTQLTGVTVSAGQNTTATIPSFPAFAAPTILSIPPVTVTGQVQIIYSSVASSNGYVVQRDTLATFATAHDTTVAAGDTSVQLTIPLRAYNVRVRAIDPEGATGVPSAVSAVAAISSMTVTPATITKNPGDTVRFTATAKDATGATVAGVTFFWSSSNQAAATIDQTGLATAVGGGSTTISGLGLGVPGGATLTVTGGVAKSLVYTTQPAATTAGTALSPAIQVEVRDTNGALVPTARNPVTLAIASGPGGTLLGTTTVNAINGVASFSGLSIQLAGGGYTISASSSGLAGATSSAFAISPGAPVSLAFTTQPGGAEGNVAIAPAVTVAIVDAYGNAVTTATNSITLAVGKNPWANVITGAKGGTLSGTKTKAAVGGVATFSNLSVDRPATGYTLTASAAGLASATTNSFNVDLTMQSVSATGYVHSCGVAIGGAYCWGYNVYGGLGETNGSLQYDSVPALVSGGVQFTQVVAGGEFFSCGLTSAGAAYCWGYNPNGQLGNGATGTALQSTPVAVSAPGSGAVTYTQISAGYTHVCALATGGTVYCWGSNGSGESGTGASPSAGNILTPTKVSGSIVFKSVSAGYNFTCGVSTAASGANGYCWGTNNNGQLGDSLPIPGATVGYDSVPLLVGNGRVNLNWTALSAGYDHTCGVLKSVVSGFGNGQCWGSGGSGQLGVGMTTTTSDSLPVVYVSGALTWSSISASAENFTCGVVSATNVGSCWGLDADGELGDGSNTEQNVPVNVAGTLAFTAINIGGLGSPYYHACGLVGTSVYCWGGNTFGQLGIGNKLGQNMPTQIVQ